MASDLWYYVKDGESQEPVAWNVLIQMARAGKIGPHDQIWNESLPRWVPASAVEGLIPSHHAPLVVEGAWSDFQPKKRSSSWIGVLSLAMGIFFCFAEMALIL